jgi:hypothetical protein
VESCWSIKLDAWPIANEEQSIFRLLPLRSLTKFSVSSARSYLTNHEVQNRPLTARWRSGCFLSLALNLKSSPAKLARQGVAFLSVLPEITKTARCQTVYRVV